MRIQEKQKALEQEVIANLCAIPKMPENMLPHTVYVEEEGEDGYGHGIPVYTMYRLEEIRTDGSCTLYNAESRERFTCRHLHEINMDWLVTVWERYLELCVEQDIWKGNAVAFLKDRTGKPEEEIISFVETSWDKCQAYTDNLKAFLGEDKDREIWIFSFPLDEFERDVPEGLYAYDIRESDDGDRLATIEPTVMVNHGGTILTRKEFITEKDGYVQIDEYGFEASMTLEEWLEENN